MIVQVGSECYLYHGVLEDYFTDRDGQLDRVVISGAARRFALRRNDHARYPTTLLQRA